jgi:hypothetical protein
MCSDFQITIANECTVYKLPNLFYYYTVYIYIVRNLVIYDLKLVYLINDD